MGLFSQQPEEPTEWAGLPSEPREPETAAERLDAAAADPLGIAGSGSTSISIPMPPTIERAPTEPGEA
jgi:hypothetical protein